MAAALDDSIGSMAHDQLTTGTCRARVKPGWPVWGETGGALAHMVDGGGARPRAAVQGHLWCTDAVKE